MQLEGRIEDEGEEDVGDEAGEGDDAMEEADKAADAEKEDPAEEKEAKELVVLLSRLHMGCWPLHFRDSKHTLVRGPISS